MRRISHRPYAAAAREFAPTSDFSQPERLVGLGFRYWMQGYKTGDISRWEKAWCTYSSALGADIAKDAVCHLSGWVRAMNNRAHRALETSAGDCAAFCRDECMAISMIAACQHEACPAMRACAFALLGCSMIDEVVTVAENFAATMRRADQVLSPEHAAGLLLLSTMPAATAARH